MGENRGTHNQGFWLRRLLRGETFTPRTRGWTGSAKGLAMEGRVWGRMGGLVRTQKEIDGIH